MKKINSFVCFFAMLLCLCCLVSCDWINKQFSDNTPTVEETKEEIKEDDPISTIDGIVFMSNGDGTCYVEGYNDDIDSKVVIPNKSPNGDKVTSIGENAFKKCTSITNVELPEGIKSISEGAFYGCKNLTNISIPKSVTTIEKDVFYACPKLVEEKDGVLYVDKWIVDCDSSATQVNIKTGTKGISEYAFAGCKSLKSVVITNGITKICSYAFKDCTSLRSVVIYKSVTCIEKGAFMNCSSLNTFYYTGNMSEWQTIDIVGFYVATSDDEWQGRYLEYVSKKENGPFHTASIVYNYVPK